MSFANKYEIKPDQVFQLLKTTALKSKDPVSDAEVAAFMIVCNQYDLNPFIKEIFGFISKGKMQYVISVDGWATLINRQTSLNGIEFDEHFAGEKLVSITCKIHRKDRALPTVITEYLSECKRDTDTWKQWPVRMLRHKAMIQCSRIAFGLAGVLDEDEAERMSDFPAPVLEGKSTRRALPEIERYMEALGWNEAKKNVSRGSFAGNPEGHLAFVKGEAAKANIVIDEESRGHVLQMENSEPDINFAEESQETREEDETPAQETGTTAEASTSATAPSGAKKTITRKADPGW